MNALGHLALIAWTPAVLMIFSLARDRRRAVIICYVAAWLFLPVGGYDPPGLPRFDKFTATSLSVMLGVLLFEPQRLARLRMRWFDLPLVVFCLCPLVSSLTNGLGAYDGLSAVATQMVMWGLPYAIGRMFLADPRSLFELGRVILVGALLYVPIIIFESRMSVLLHKWIYGMQVLGNWQQIGIFGPLRFKPAGFFDSALALTMFMASAVLLGLWLRFVGRVRHVASVPMKWVLPVVFAGAVLGKTLGALVLMMGGVGVFLGTLVLRRPVALLCLVLVAPTYLFVRAGDLWSGRALVDVVSQTVDERKGMSLLVRLENEERLREKALERPVFGWGRWGRSRVYNERGQDISLTDGLWIIVLGQSGLVGLVSLYLVLLLPSALLVFRQEHWFCIWPGGAAASAFGVILALYSIDCLFNAMINPILILALGSLAGLPRIPRAVAMRRRVMVPAVRGSRPLRQVPGDPAPSGAFRGPRIRTKETTSHVGPSRHR